MQIQKISTLARSNNFAPKIKENKPSKHKYNQINELSNIYYSPINFARSLKEHQSWGLRLHQDGSASAKIFAFPDSKSVKLEVIDKGVFELENKGEGIFETKKPITGIQEKDKYYFLIEKADGTVEKVKDPYSLSQPTLTGPSEVYNHSRYKWNDKKWQNSPERISRNANKENGFKTLNEAMIYEINIATLTKMGNFDGAKKELQRIKNLGFNTVEIMPVENTCSYNWGYDGVDKFAVSTFLGGADKLKEFIDEAHNTGLNVIMDMVPNHLGTDGAQLQKTGPYIKGSTAWGDGFNYEGENSRYVRDYIVNAALGWLRDFHCDGLRLDMTQAMESDTTMQQIAAEVNAHHKDAFLIAEDGRNEKRIITPLVSYDIGADEGDDAHNRAIDRIQEGAIPYTRVGFDSAWYFYGYHIFDDAIKCGYPDLYAIKDALVNAGSRVRYSASHDEIGNTGGIRPTAQYMVSLLNLVDNVVLNEEDIQRASDFIKLPNKEHFSFEFARDVVVKSQKAQLIAQKLAQMVQDGSIETYRERHKRPLFNEEVLEKLELNKNSNLTPIKIMKAFDLAVQKYRAMEALKYFAPGPVMTFQGEENIDMTKFNFFREFESIKNENYLYTEKGYPFGKQAYEESILGNMKYSSAGMRKMKQFENLTVDLNNFKANNQASTNGKIVEENTIIHRGTPAIAFHTKDEDSGNEIFIVTNFSSKDYPHYEIEFPVGNWREIINTDDSRYGGSGEYKNIEIIKGRGLNKQKSVISLPSDSSVIFKKV